MASTLVTIFKRELKGYFQTPIGFVFMAVYLFLSGIFTFYVGHFFEDGNANLEAFFLWQPWLYLFLMPAITMRLWAEEKRNGSFELLMTLPITIYEMVLGKFFSSFAFALINLLLTIPIVITVNYLGDPDNGVIIASYFSSILVMASFLALGACISAITTSQVVAFILTITISFLFMCSGFVMVLNFFISMGLPQFIINIISDLSIVTNFQDMIKGVIPITALVYFISFIISCIMINIAILRRV